MDTEVPMEEEEMYTLLGLRDEDERASAQVNAAGTFVGGGSGDGANDTVFDTEGAAIPVDDLIPEEQHVIYDREHPEMKKGSKFPSMGDFRLAIRQYAINKEFDMGTLKSDTTRFTGYRRADRCNWKIVARRMADKKIIRVTKIHEDHKCLSSNRIKSSMASQAWVASKAVLILRTHPNMSAKEMQLKLEDDYNETILYDTVWKGRQRVVDTLYGTWEQNFQYLYNWKAKLELRSPGSIVEIGTKTVKAFGFIELENEDNWAWIMTRLHRAIGHLPKLAICTDACKGLENAVKNVFPHAEQRECFRHLMTNFVKKYHDDSSGHMWPTARAYRPDVFDYHLGKILQACPDVADWLRKHHKLKWMRCSFDIEIKCDHINNNLAESFNNWVKDIKDLPVDELADKLREMVMVLFRKRRRIGGRLQGRRILPAIIQQLHIKSRGLGHLKVTPSAHWSA